MPRCRAREQWSRRRAIIPRVSVWTRSVCSHPGRRGDTAPDAHQPRPALSVYCKYRVSLLRYSQHAVCAEFAGSQVHKMPRWSKWAGTDPGKGKKGNCPGWHLLRCHMGFDRHCKRQHMVGEYPQDRGTNIFCEWRVKFS